MQYTINCDNCGGEFQAGCFGSVGGVTYYSPPVESVEIQSGQYLTNEEYKILEGLLMLAYAKSAMTSLCTNCINQ